MAAILFTTLLASNLIHLPDKPAGVKEVSVSRVFEILTEADSMSLSLTQIKKVTL